MIQTFCSGRGLSLFVMASETKKRGGRSFAEVGRIFGIPMLLLLMAGCSCGTGSSTADAGSTEAGVHDAPLRDAVFDSEPSPFLGMDLDSMGCEQLELAWFAADSTSDADWQRECTVAEDCVLVDTNVDCKGVEGSDIAIQNCPFAYAIVRARESEWSDVREVLARSFCETRTVPIMCGESALCPMSFVAICEAGRCLAR